MKVTVQNDAVPKQETVREHSCVSPLLPLVTPGPLSTHWAALQHKLGTLPLNSALILTGAGTDHTDWKAQPHEMALPCRCQWQVMPPRLPTTSNQRKGSESEVSQSCLTLCNYMDCSLWCTSVHGIFQARVLEWVAISFSRGSFGPRDRTQVSHITSRHFTLWATKEAYPTWLQIRIPTALSLN